MATYSVTVRHIEIREVIIDIPDEFDSELLIKVEAETHVASYDTEFRNKSTLLSNELVSAESRAVAVRNAPPPGDPFTVLPL